VEEGYVWSGYVSRWWRELIRLDVPNWFNSETTRKVGNDANTKFWEKHCRGDLAFRVKYPQLFSLSNQKDAKVEDLSDGVMSEGGWCFSWRCHLFVWENEMLLALMEELEGFLSRQ